MVTVELTAPDVGLTLVMAGVTVNDPPSLPFPPTVTTTSPVVAPAGTATTMLVLLQELAAAVVPLKVTVLLPCVEPNPVPVIVTEVPIGPEVGEKLVML